MEVQLKYYCDTKRHLVCSPYSLGNLHKMAKEFNIKKCWFHKNHYDIPKTRVKEITDKCELVDSREIVDIIKYDSIPEVPTTGACHSDHFTQEEFLYNGLD